MKFTYGDYSQVGFGNKKNIKKSSKNAQHEVFITPPAGSKYTS